MKFFFFTFFLSLLYFLAEAQEEVVKFGDVSSEELSTKNYSSDTSAAAVIIFDKGSSTVAGVGSRALTYKRHVRIKIFRKEAFSDWANVSLLVERGAFSKLKGITYNLEKDGIVKSEIDDNSIYKTRYNKYIDLIKFTLPNVKEGSVIEYSYVIKGDGVPQWQFQYAIPVMLSEYEVEVPSFSLLRHTIKGLLSPSHEEEKNGTQKWVLNNVPAFKAEPFMPNESDYVSSIKFSFSLSTWASINARMYVDENFGGTIKGFPFLKKEAEEIAAKLTDPKQKIIAIHQYIKDHLEWNGTEDIYAADDLKDNFKKKKGTAADINLAMASMLDKAGIRVEMVLLSTRGNGFVRMDNPTTRQFDYTICLAYADTTAYLLDATEKYLPWYVLPERCLNGVGLVISENYRWINVDTKAKGRTVVAADMILNDNGELQGKLTYTKDGYAAYEMRNSLQQKGKELYLDNFAKKHTWSVQKSEFINLEEIEKPAIEMHEISIQEYGTKAGGFVYIDPFITFKEEENPFKAEKRQFPIDFGIRNEKIYLTNIVIPDGYQVDEIPQSKVMLLPQNKGKFTYNVSQTGNRLTVVSSIQMNERIFMQDEYPNLREFYNRIVAKHAEQIVLKRK